MQEDVENKTVRLAVQTLKLTFRGLYAAWKKADAKFHKEMAKIEASKDEAVKGEQTVKELIGKGEGVSKIDIEQTGLKDFKKMAKKFGVDFAIVKDSKEDPPVYTIFFKAKDGAAIEKAMEAYAAKDLKMDKDAPKTKERPSILKKLEHFKNIVAKTPHKAKEKKKELDR